jgi:hypothetical protein
VRTGMRRATAASPFATPRDHSTCNRRSALSRIPAVRTGKRAVRGSAALALHGLPVVPRDLDLIVDQSAAAELILELGDAVMRDEWSWDRGDVMAVRRALAVVNEFDVEILIGVETVAGGVTLLGR